MSTAKHRASGRHAFQWHFPPSNDSVCESIERASAHRWRYNHPQSAHSLHKILRGQHVAVVMVGEPFRRQGGESGTGPEACVASSADAQEEAHRSILAAAVCPLERHGAQVDIMFTVPTDCDDTLVAQVHSVFGARVVAVARTRSENHLEGLQNAFGRLIVPRSAAYDFVLQTRHDLYLSQAITRWPMTADLTHVLFEQECQTCGNSCSCGR